MTTIHRPRRIEQPSQDGAAKPKQKGVLHYIGTGVSFGLLSLVLLLGVLVVALPMLTHSTPYTVLTSSMTPTYPAGTLVVVKPTPTDQIHLGDVVTYQLKSKQPEVVTHRVIQIIEPTKPGDSVKFVTKGDANSLADPAIIPIQVRGVVWYAVPYIGWVNNVINGDTRSVIIPILAGGLFLYAGIMVAMSFFDRRRKRAAAAAAAERDEKLDAELRELVDAHSK